MKILHSSDWHLGKRLYRQSRDREHAAFLTWLLETIQRENVEILLVAGDIFDTATPSISAQQLYYDFLHRLSATPCRHTVIIAGNHDSPTFIHAPQALLKQLNIHVIGAARMVEETFILPTRTGQPALIVSAVPYLRERDLRQLIAGETLQQKAAQTAAAIAAHYAGEAEKVAALRAQHGNLPALAMGHLFAAGATTYDDDGVRELYVGNLGHVGAEIFPAAYDYVALGHIHIPQTVAGQRHIRYAGAPLPIGFGEAGQQKQVLLLDMPTEHGEPWGIQSLPVPTWQRLANHHGERAQLLATVQQYVAAGAAIWLELHYTGAEHDAALHQDLQALCANTPVKILCLRHENPLNANLNHAAAGENLAALTPERVFAHCLDEHHIAADKRDALIAAHDEILQQVRAGGAFDATIKKD